MPSLSKSKVFRLRNLPRHVDRLSAAKLLASALRDDVFTFDSVQIFSLALAVDDWKRRRTKVATLMFEKIPTAVDSHSGSVAQEWSFDVPGLPSPLILDTHFRGMTPLNEVSTAEHEHDCIVLSGLASHPFGSWQPRGSDKSFMWIRDAAPARLPGIRFIIWGYDTALEHSNSFQTTSDLSLSLLSYLEANGWTSPTSKPLMFLAHSLGGVVLKQAFVYLAGGNSQSTALLSRIKGAIFFGVPSVGMPMSHLMTLIGDQPNQVLLKELSDESDFVAALQAQFAGISYIRKMKLFWAYETQTSSTVSRSPGGTPTRSGLIRQVTLTRESATAGCYYSDPESTIQIDEDHSNMVKFSRGDDRVHVFLAKIRAICINGTHPPESFNPADELEALSAEQLTDEPMSEYSDQSSLISNDFDVDEAFFWDFDLILDALRAPERDHRLHQIRERSSNTFDWAFEDRSTGLAQWLRRGSGIFWIRGKPGSGKSTFMKYLLNDAQTAQLLHDWKSKSRQITASFFFHHRGTPLQKSFEGLLRSILSQILEAEPRLMPLVLPIVKDRFRERVTTGMYRDAHSDIRELFHRCSLQYPNPGLQRDILYMLSSRNPVSRLVSLLRDLRSEPTRAAILETKKVLLGFYSKMLNFEEGNQRVEYIRTRFGRVSLAAKDPAGLQRLIQVWYENVSLEDGIYDLLKRHMDQKGTLEVLSHVKHFVQRQTAREQLRLKAMGDEWSILELQDGFRQIFDQQLFKLDISLLVDALDEYDGSKVSISGFLKDMTEQSPSSKTLAKILFSSRPWSIFREEFGACSGFDIHDYTQEDIYNYYIGSIPKTIIAQSLLFPLADEVVSRARGVFLWVRLVTHDLAKLITSNRTGDELPAKVRQTLGSIPDELEDYYLAIIERTPPQRRWETFVLLESISRTSFPLYFADVVKLVNYSSGRTYSDNHRAWMQSRVTSYDEYVKNISGGLVETTRDGLVQFMHQTVKDWVESPNFKAIMLGDQAKMVPENGHSFLAKFVVQDSGYRSHTLYHAREAEHTTGVSQFVFLSSLPGEIFQSLFPDDAALGLITAVSGGLFLYLKDCLQHYPWILKRTSLPLWSAVFQPETLSLNRKYVDLHLEIQSKLDMASFLVKNGFRVEKDEPGVLSLLYMIWDNLHQEVAQSGIDVLTIALSVSRSMIIDPLFEYGFTLLHHAPPALASRLLDLGADVNALDDSGATPLDSVIDTRHEFQMPSHGLSPSYDMACLLVRNGGRLNKSNGGKWRDFLKRLLENGFDVAPLAGVQDENREESQDDHDGQKVAPQHQILADVRKPRHNLIRGLYMQFRPEKQGHHYLLILIYVVIPLQAILIFWLWY